LGELKVNKQYRSWVFRTNVSN